MKTRQVLLFPALLVILVSAWMLLRNREGEKTGISPDAPAASLKVRIKDVKVIPNGDHAQLMVTAEFEQSGQSLVSLEPPWVTLLTADQVPADRYIGPMLPDPVLSGSGPSEITLNYWLPLARLKSPLTLKVTGNTHTVKVPGF